jgi:hypothetical protein
MIVSLYVSKIYLKLTVLLITLEICYFKFRGLFIKSHTQIQESCLERVLHGLASSVCHLSQRFKFY